MSLPKRGSARWSARVEPGGANREVMAGPGVVSAPESTPAHRSLGTPAGGRHRRVGQRRLLRLSADLSQRERDVLISLAELRFLTTGQLQRLHFADHATEGAA